MKMKKSPDDLGKKPLNKLSLNNVEGVQKNRKFATSRVLRFAFALWLFWMIRSCLFPITPKQQEYVQQPKTPTSIEEVLPPELEHYQYSNLVLEQTSYQNVEVYTTDGTRLGILGSAYALKNNQGEVVSYRTGNAFFDSLGRRVAILSQEGVYSKDGQKLGELKSSQELEKIIDSEQNTLLQSDKSIKYLIFTQDPISEEYKITGVIDNFPEKQLF